MHNPICHLTCKHCGASTPLAGSPDGRKWRFVGEDGFLEDGLTPLLAAFIALHGSCYLIDRKEPAVTPFTLTYTADKETTEAERRDLEMTPEQLAHLDRLRELVD